MFFQKERSSAKCLRHCARRTELLQPVQAKIGFEFESARWRVNKRPEEVQTEGLTEEEFRIAKQYKKGHVLFENAFWSAQADVDENWVSFLELVTVPFEEDEEGYRQLEEAAVEMETFFNYAFQAPHYTEENIRIVDCRAFRRFGEIKSPEARIELPEDDPNPLLVPQATAGIRLSKLHKLMGDIAAPMEDEPESVKKRKLMGRTYLLGDFDTGGLQKGAAINARYVAEAADIVLKEVKKKWGKHLSDAFKGFFSLVVYYLLEGYRGSLSYPKAFIALLARTDFSRMFSLLPEEEKAFLSANGAAYWFEMIRAVLPECQKDFSQPFFNKGVYLSRSEIHRHILKNLSKEQWLLELMKGRDLLTERHFPNRWRAYELESLGAMGDKTDTVLGEPAPVIEFRAGKKHLDAGTAMLYAREMFKTIYALNRGHEYYFGESLEI